MNPSSHPEPLDILLRNARKDGSAETLDGSAPFGLKTKVLARVRESGSSECLAFWRRGSLILSGVSLAVLVTLVLGTSEPSQGQPTAAILPLPSLDLGDASTPVK